MLNKALRIARKFENLNISDMSTRTGLSIAYISEIETGKKTINETVLKAYSEVLDLPESSFYLISESISGKSNSHTNRKIGKLLKWIAD